MLKTSRQGHMSTRLHLEAVAEAAASAQSTQHEDSAPNLPERGPVAPQPPAALRWTITSYLATDSGPEDCQESIANVEPMHGVSFSGGQVYQNGNRVVFSAGEDPRKAENERRKQLYEKLTNLTIYQDKLVSQGLQIDEDDINEDFTDGLPAALRALDELERLEESEEIMDGVESISDDNWEPHGSKTTFMLDLLDNLPRLRLSDDHMKAILWVMRECGTPDVPSFSALRKVQTQLQELVGLNPRHHTSSLGNHFYVNHPGKLIALDWANPFVRKNMVFYPEIDPSVPVAEMWQAGKWVNEVPVDDLSPMWYDGTSPGRKHFYINEITERRDGSFILPRRWVTLKGIVHCQAFLLSYSENERAFSLADPDITNVPALDLWRNAPDLLCEGRVQLRFSPNLPPQLWMSNLGSPHPLRAKANGRPAYRLRVMPWSDDVSGNVSKQYNPHTNIYIQNLNIPHKNLTQEYFVRFCSTSSYASSSEQFSALVRDFDHDVWHDAYDCLLEEEVVFQIIPHILPADNPQQSEHASHIGGNGLSNCRRDTTGGRDEEKETDEGYCALFKPGRPRKPIETVDTLKAQVRLACYGKRDDLQSNITQTGVKDKIAQHWIELFFAKSQELQKERLKDRESRDPRLNERLSREERSRIKEVTQRNIQHELWNEVVKQWAPGDDPELDASHTDLRPGVHYNPLLNTRGIDPHADTPVEILHTWLLGNEKYVWHDTTKGWSKIEEALFAARLQASHLGGLTTPPPRANYLVQYKNSLIGKHFKILQQLAIFHLHDLCSDMLFELWRAAGELGALMWIPEIDNLEEYLDDLQVLIDNLLDAWASFDPGRILVKVKLHVLTHLVDDVRRFGPAILYSTEVFECWNAIFRLCSVFSNHLAPSKDIADTLACMERFKHIISGGWWKVQDRWTQAGPSIRQLFATNREIQRRLGWSDENRLERGTVKRQSRTKLQPGTSASLELLDVVNLPAGFTWDHCRCLISQSQDVCVEGSWVFYTHGEGIVGCGRIVKILVKQNKPPVSTNSCVVLERFLVSSSRDVRLNMPVLEPAQERISVTPINILFPFNAQHDCVGASCQVIQQDSTPVVQERIPTKIFKPILRHGDLPRYFLNTHALHNLHLVRKTLPRDLTKPVPYSSDREAHRKAAAAQLRITGPQKRAEAQKKAQMTREKNRKAGQAANPQPTLRPPTTAASVGDVPEGDDGDLDFDVGQGIFQDL